MTRSATKSTARNIRPLRLSLLRHLRKWLGNVGDAFVRKNRPLATIKVAAILGIVVIIGERIPRPKRRVIITHAGNKMVIRVSVVRSDLIILIV